MRELQDERGNTGGRAAMRAQHLDHLGRTDDALSAYREALASDPDDARLLQQLAHCQFRSGKEAAMALETIDRAIELEPNDPINHVIRSLILADQHQPKLAKRSAEEAIALEPEEPGGYSALANAHMRTRTWPAAEIAAKQALALDPDEELAANLLAHALFCQGKQVENQVHIDGLLHQDPEDPYTHYAAGLSALQGEDYPKAEEHFLETLRLDPNFEPAREGLLNVFRARSIFYRSYLRYAFFMTRLTPGQRVGFMLGLLIAVQILMRSMKQVSPTISLAIGALYILFVVWTYVATSVGSLIVLGDRRARHALKPVQKVDAVLVGGGVVVGVVLVAIGLIGSIGWATGIGAGLISMAVPLVLFFINEHPKGKKLYGALAGLGVLALLGLIIGTVFPTTGIFEISVIGSLSALILATWLKVFGVWHR